jgi:hypothetical protein
VLAQASELPERALGGGVGTVYSDARSRRTEEGVTVCQSRQPNSKHDRGAKNPKGFRI